MPGTWILPPAVGLVWTSGYWGYEGERYIWHAGYWGPHVGYYGGIYYGFGYFGSGYEGGHWENGVFFYNTAVTRVNTAVITTTYNKTAISSVSLNNVSFNGPGGITAQPTAQEAAWSRERHAQPTALQVKHQRTASANRALFAAVNHGTPPVAATAKAGVFKGPDIVGSKGLSDHRRDWRYWDSSQDGTGPGASGEGEPEVGHMLRVDSTVPALLQAEEQLPTLSNILRVDLTVLVVLLSAESQDQVPVNRFRVDRTI